MWKIPSAILFLFGIALFVRTVTHLVDGCVPVFASRRIFSGLACYADNQGLFWYSLVAWFGISVAFMVWGSKGYKSEFNR
jgi:TRAP-type C4-dicarboxylate transport system permease small subunit|tara:strand:- start:103 stop:342 length:240 start_codon:yes stop_codon:yes gene_type:complete